MPSPLEEAINQLGEVLIFASPDDRASLEELASCGEEAFDAVTDDLPEALKEGMFDLLKLIREVEHHSDPDSALT
ncbi:MAG: hypothetical protein JXX28_03925, partial [Deltaproteobacteria bacterium]|nr:hypothetical protein [Deltaproteobacteria bacterium]